MLLCRARYNEQRKGGGQAVRRSRSHLIFGDQTRHGKLPAVAYHPLDPPLRFALLCSSLTSSSSGPPHSLYRGSLPKPHNYAFLSSLHLKTIISLTPKSLDHYAGEGLLPARKRRRIGGVGEELEDEERWEAWRDREGVRVVHVRVGKAKDGAIPFSPTAVKEVLELLVNKENYPVYMHDLDGSDVLSIMGAALRKLQGWSEKAWLAEMSRFLRQPPPEPEHLTFLRRLFSPSIPCPTSPPPAAPLTITIPPPSKRVDWLWKGGLPTAASLGAPPPKKPNGKEGQTHATMRCRLEEDPLPPPSSVSAEDDAAEDAKGDAEGKEKEQQQRDRAEALGVGRQRSVTPNHGHRSRIVTPSTPNRSRAPSPVISAMVDSLGDLTAISGASDGGGQEGEGDEEEEDQEDEDEEDEEDDEDGYEDEDEVHPLSQTIDALDLGL